MADLTHDNRDEMIVLERLETDYFSGMLHIYHVSDGGDVVEIYEDDITYIRIWMTGNIWSNTKIHLSN